MARNLEIFNKASHGLADSGKSFLKTKIFGMVQICDGPPGQCDEPAPCCQDG